MKLKMNLKMSRKWPKNDYREQPVVCTYLNFCHNAWKDADLQLNLFARMAQRASRTSTIHITHVS